MDPGLKKILRSGLLFVRDILDPLLTFQEVSVLCYHSISDVPFDTNIVPAQFESQLKMFSAQGYAFVSLSDIVSWMDGTKKLPKKAVALTFDDGYADFESVVVPLARAYHAPVALFVVGDVELARAYLGQENTFVTKEAIERLKQEPLVELGWHSRTHPHFDALSGEALAQEVTPPFPMRFFAYPGGKYSDEAIAAVKKAGYAAAFSIKPTLVHTDSNKYLMPRNVITKDMALWEVHFCATAAVDWYRTLRRLLD